LLVIKLRKELNNEKKVLLQKIITNIDILY